MPFGFGNFRARKSRTASNTRKKRGREPAKVLVSDTVGSSAKIDDSVITAPLRCLAANQKILEGCPAAPDAKKQPIMSALRSASSSALKKPQESIATACVEALKKKTLEKKPFEAKVRAARKADAAQVWLNEALKLAHQELTGGGVKSAKESASELSKNNQVETGEVKLKYYGDYTNKPETGFTLKVKIPRHQAEEGKQGSVEGGLGWIYHDPEMTFTGTTKASRVESWTTINHLPPQLVVHIYRFDYIAGAWKDASMVYPEELSVPLSEDPEDDESWRTREGPTYRICGVVAQTDAKSAKFEAYVPLADGEEQPSSEKWLHQDASGKTSTVSKEVAMNQLKTASLLFYTQTKEAPEKSATKKSGLFSGMRPVTDDDMDEDLTAYLATTAEDEDKEDTEQKGENEKQKLNEENPNLVDYLLGEKNSEDFTASMSSPVKHSAAGEKENKDGDGEVIDADAENVIVIE